MTDYAGNDSQAILYYPWGQVWSNPGGNSLLQVYASLTLYDTSADGYVPPFRYYIPEKGRWLTPDPLAGDIMNPQSLNRYAYVGNNPTSFTDRLGLCPPGQANCGPPHAPTCYTSSCAFQYYGWGPYPGFSDASYASGECVQDGVEGPCGEINWDTVVQCPNNYCGFVGAYNSFGQSAIFQFHPTQTDPTNYQQLTPWTYGGLTPQQYMAAYVAQLDATVQALLAQGANADQIEAFLKLNANPSDPNSFTLEGGNFHFGGADLFNFGCGSGLQDRCDEGSLGTLDFSHQDGTVHLDTADPFNFPGGLLLHLGVDVILGYMWYEAIPRPWP